MSEYQLTVKRKLSEEERQALYEKHWPVLQRLASRYLPMVDTSRGMPCRVEFVDALRGSWLLDKRDDRPPYEDVVSGAGFAFGMLLAELLAMEWCLIEDTFGESISMVKFGSRPEATYREVSVPPFSYVAKRKDTQNVEVFADGMRKFEEMIKG
ncbi:MAG TPA: hypothetical protein VG734_09690 [Lacunisphaera sp.]|nr:hypothetical protein [Lacunisphaera sp.]